MHWNATTFSRFLLGSSLSLLATWELTWTLLQLTNTTLNASGTQYFSVLSKSDHFFRKICDWRVMDAMKCYKNLFYIIHIGEYFIIASCMSIDLNCLTSDQYYIKYLWNSQYFSVLPKLDHFFLKICDWRVMDVMKCYKCWSYVLREFYSIFL
jgi:hypothetical protein